MYRYCKNEEYGIELVKFDRLEKYDDLIHAFTTRTGGVSEGHCKSLNLSFKREDNHNNVLQNFERVAKTLSVDYKLMVGAQQVHGNKVGIVKPEHKGTGITEKCYFTGYDALVTNIPKIALTTLHGDCVPVYFWDNQNKAVGIAHSGWKSTLMNISSKLIATMVSEYGTNPELLQVVIGPSICKKCFEVKFDVYKQFADAFPKAIEFNLITQKFDEACDTWLIDLPAIIKLTLLESCFLEENIDNTNICTCCDEDKYFSHRRDKGLTGGMAGIVCIK